MRVSLNDVEGVSSIYVNGAEITHMSVRMFIQMRLKSLTLSRKFGTLERLT